MVPHLSLDEIESRYNSNAKPDCWVPMEKETAWSVKRKVKVACIGAGFSGMMFAQKVYFEDEYKGRIDLTVYDKNASVGGTWFVNNYPGVAW